MYTYCRILKRSWQFMGNTVAKETCTFPIEIMNFNAILYNTTGFVFFKYPHDHLMLFLRHLQKYINKVKYKFKSGISLKKPLIQDSQWFWINNCLVQFTSKNNRSMGDMWHVLTTYHVVNFLKNKLQFLGEIREKEYTWSSWKWNAGRGRDLNLSNPSVGNRPTTETSQKQEVFVIWT